MEQEFKGETMWRLLLSLEAPRNDRQSQNTVDREHAHLLSPLSEVRLSCLSRYENQNVHTLCNLRIILLCSDCGGRVVEEHLSDSLQMPDSFVLIVSHPPIGVGIVMLEIRKSRLRKAKQLIEGGTVNCGAALGWEPRVMRLCNQCFHKSRGITRNQPPCRATVTTNSRQLAPKASPVV